MRQLNPKLMADLEENHTKDLRVACVCVFCLFVCCTLTSLQQKVSKALTVVPGCAGEESKHLNDCIGAFLCRCILFAQLSLSRAVCRQPLFHLYTGKAVTHALGRRSRHDSIA